MCMDARLTVLHTQVKTHCLWVLPRKPIEIWDQKAKTIVFHLVKQVTTPHPVIFGKEIDSRATVQEKQAISCFMEMAHKHMGYTLWTQVRQASSDSCSQKFLIVRQRHLTSVEFSRKINDDFFRGTKRERGGVGKRGNSIQQGAGIHGETCRTVRKASKFMCPTHSEA